MISVAFYHEETTIVIDHLMRDSEGRNRYGYTIHQDGEFVVHGDQLRSGVGASIDFDEMLRALLSFADAYSESVRPGGWSADYGVFDGRVLDNEDLALTEWFYQHGEDLPLSWRFSEDELDG